MKFVVGNAEWASLQIEIFSRENVSLSGGSSAVSNCSMKIICSRHLRAFFINLSMFSKTSNYVRNLFYILICAM